MNKEKNIYYLNIINKNQSNFDHVTKSINEYNLNVDESKIIDIYLDTGKSDGHKYKNKVRNGNTIFFNACLLRGSCFKTFSE